MKDERPQILFVFIDGLGIGSRDPAMNPMYAGNTPALVRLLDELAVPIDAQLGVPGLPQSATGQTTLLTGVNASRRLGRHIEGFPNEALKKIIREHNIYHELCRAGLQCTFANAYYVDKAEEIGRYRRHSVTTVAALSGIGTVRMKDSLLRNEAVYHDLTRSALRERGFDGPFIEPEVAARHLLELAMRYDFTLFEYFMTDRLGHRGSPEEVQAMLIELDRFMHVLLEEKKTGRMLLLVTSDHGNIESAGHALHTVNPVPFVAMGCCADTLRREVSCLADVAPAILRLFGIEPHTT